MKLLTKSIERKLKANAISGVKFGTDHKPVVKFFGGGACTWLIVSFPSKSGGLIIL